MVLDIDNIPYAPVDQIYCYATEEGKKNIINVFLFKI